MIRDMRAELATMLQEAVGITCYAYPPGIVSPPSITVMPGSPYIDGQFMDGRAGLVAFDLNLVTQAMSPETLDQLIWDTVHALGVRGIHVDQVSSPTYSDIASTLGCRISVTLKWKA